MKKIIFHIFLSIIICIIVVISCKKEEITTTKKSTIPSNPYDTITRDTTTIKDPTVDSTSIIGLHKNIFSVKCAQPACHDGSFEPDFRTIQSAYSTLVYHKVFKYTSDSAFEYRVVPGDTGLSWLHERITTDDVVLGRMPLYDTLSQYQINNITAWILNNARDMFGNTLSYPDYQPNTFGMLAYLNDTNGARIDTIRTGSPFDPFEVRKDSIVDIWLGMYDIDDNGDFVLAQSFTYNKIKFSKTAYNFTSAPELSLQKLIMPYMGPGFGSSSKDAPYFHHYQLNTSQYNVGDVVYFRAYVSDGENLPYTELPDNGSLYYLVGYFSLKIVS